MGGVQQDGGIGQVSRQEIPTEKVEEKVDEILSTKKAEITPQKTIEIDRNVDSEDKAIKDNRGKKPNGYYIDVANLQEDGTADRVWEKAENAMPVKEYPTLDIFSHKKNGKVIISENNTGKKLVEADTIKEAKEKLKELIYKNGGELAFKDKLEKQSAQNSENNTNLVEDKAENEGKAEMPTTERYLDGESITSIAKSYNVDFSVIKKRLEMKNVKFRNNSEAHRKYKYNRKIFNKIDTPLKAYFLGFILGSLS